MATRKTTGALGQKVSPSEVTQGPPPVVLQAQPDSHIRLTTPDQLKQFAQDVENFYGIRFDPSQTGMIYCETCSGGCSDDCGFLA
jgi:hypothetical protein